MLSLPLGPLSRIPAARFYRLILDSSYEAFLTDEERQLSSTAHTVGLDESLSLVGLGSYNGFKFLKMLLNGVCVYLYMCIYIKCVYPIDI